MERYFVKDSVKDSSEKIHEQSEGLCNTKKYINLLTKQQIDDKTEDVDKTTSCKVKIGDNKWKSIVSYKMRY